MEDISMEVWPDPAVAAGGTPPKPMHLSAGQRLTVKVVDMGFGGEGVARAGEFVVFVPMVLPGEEVEVEVREVKKRFARAQLVRVISPSVSRVQPPCRYFGECGGCQYQHVDYAAQLRIKHKQVVDLFVRVGKFTTPPIAPVVGCPQPFGYRNRLLLRTQWNRESRKIMIGFLRQDSRMLVDVEACPIAEPILNEQLKQVRENPPERGGPKVALRVEAEGWDVPPHSFFQNNFILLPELVRVVRERLKDAGTQYLVDAYCGVGFFSLELADLVKEFVGIEYDAPAIGAARANAERRRARHGEFVAAKAEDEIPRWLRKFPAAQTTVVLDPPRTGCVSSMLESLLDARPQQVLYVSCHPATLARDTSALCGSGGYQLKQVIPLDMFPQTQHVECVADLRLQTPHA